MFKRTILTTGVLLSITLLGPVLAVDDSHRAKAEAVIERATRFLLSRQTPEGAWSAEPGPAITGLVLAGLLENPKVARNDPAIRKALDYLLSRQKPSGGIYDTLLENYNTSICLMALGRVHDDPRAAEAVEKAQGFLRGLQWADQNDPTGARISESHPWHGGAGYGKHGRPDLSNTAMMIAGLHDSGLDCKDPAYIRAVSFITKLQGTKANTETGDQIVPDGGFIYATSTSKDNIGTLQTMTDPPTEKDSLGRDRLRTYGSMTYAGFMSYLYAELDRDDPRVRDAYNWVRHNYNVRENPRVGMQGYYYYLHLFSRAMHAWGEPVVETAEGKRHDWAHDLIDRLAELQQPDGSFVNEADRWMEGDTNLVTAYAVLALQHALRE